MLKSTTEKAQDTLNTQNNAGEIPKQSSTLINRIQLTGTPFWQIHTEQGYFLVMGPNVMTPIFATEQELDDYIKENHWDLVCLLVLTLLDTNKNPTKYETTSL